MILENENKAVLALQEMKRVIFGKDDCLYKMMATVLAGGHILMDDIPGVGKTTVAKTFAKVMSLDSKRVQFTPDVMPSDIVGFSMYKKDSQSFEYEPGAIMCNLFLGDEINRTSPKTQSALLEAMEEKKVTVDGHTRQLPQPFVVIATQNPVGSVGTQELPESQMDRFMICTTIGYPSFEDEMRIAKGKGEGLSLNNIRTILSQEELLQIRKEVEQVYIHDCVYEYICNLVRSTREHPQIELGVSPRGTIAIVKMAKAIAYLNNRDYVVPNDIEEVFLDVASHRIVLKILSQGKKNTSRMVLKEILKQIKKPKAGTIRKK